MTMELRANCPSGPLEQRWERHRFELKLVNPANKRKYTILVVGSGLAGASAAATLGELGYDPHDVYNNVVSSFQIGWLCAIYVIAQLALCAHLYHGAWSFLQTLGANHPQYNAWRRTIAAAAAGAIFVGYVSIPLSVLSGILRPAPSHAAERAR